MKRRLKFTLYHGFAASLALHSAIAAPFVLQRLAPEPEEAPLVIELQGEVSDTQSEQQVLAQTQGNAPQDETAKVKPAATHNPPVAHPPAKKSPAEKPADQQAAAANPPAKNPPAEQPSDEKPTDIAANDSGTPPPSPETAPTPAPPAEPTPVPPVAPTPAPPVENSSPSPDMKAGDSSNTNSGSEQQQNAQTIAAAPQDDDRLNSYVKKLARKIQNGLAYPADARRAGLHGTATVSFTILTDGQIRPNSLKIAKSSGEATLDAGALQTIRATAPFAAPPEEIAVSIALVFGRKR
jgi:periplasmic protein TonB